MAWLKGYTRVTYPHSLGLATPPTPNRAIVLHTTQGATFAGADSVYRRMQACPHFTVSYAEDLLVQHVDTELGAYALRNLAGGVETNTLDVVQVEIVGFAGGLTDGCLSWVGERCIGPIIEAHPTIPLVFDDFDTDERMTFEQWLTWAGITGHKRVPENDHTDPGPIAVHVLAESIRSYLGVNDMPLTDDDIARIWAHRVPISDGSTHPTGNLLGYIHDEVTDPDKLVARLTDALVIALPVGPTGISSDAVRAACGQAVREVLGSLG